MPRAALLLSQRVALGPEEFVELKVWQVAPTPSFPSGVKLRCAYVVGRGGAARAVYRMDNAGHGGLHEHLGGRLVMLEGLPWHEAVARFLARVREIRRSPP